VAAVRHGEAGELVQRRQRVLGEQGLLLLGAGVGTECLVERDAAAVQVRRGRRLVDQRLPLFLVAPHVDVGGATHEEVVLRNELGVRQGRDAVLDRAADAGEVEVGAQRKHVAGSVFPGPPRLPVDVVLGEAVVEVEGRRLVTQQSVGQQRGLGPRPLPEREPVGHQVLAGQVGLTELDPHLVPVHDRDRVRGLWHQRENCSGRLGLRVVRRRRLGLDGSEGPRWVGVRLGLTGRESRPRHHEGEKQRAHADDYPR